MSPEREQQPYVVQRIRLVNFHNFVNETIEVRNGGHLFLLGDNASGKTTVLDAIHYVLTAGEGMEFNSAARVAGNRDTGRRVQGVILRYNVETGPLNPAGGITYAALEIRGRQGRPLTVALGLAAHAMDESVQRWGVVRECSLEDVPFVVHELGGTRPSTRTELREALGRSGFYGNVGQYKAEIAQRLFGGPDLFRECCRLLSIGKAYREIVSHSADYHLLFKRLLPEPRTELFERVVEGLRTLEQSRDELEVLRERLQYLQGLDALVRDIAGLRLDQQGLEWLGVELGLEETQAGLAFYHERLEDKRRALTALGQELADCREQQLTLERQTRELEAADSEGLVAKESELIRGLVLKREQLEGRRREFAGLEEGLTEAESRLTECRQAYRDGVRELYEYTAKAGPDLPFPVTETTAVLDRVLHAQTAEETDLADAVLALEDAAREALGGPEREVLLAEAELAAAQDRCGQCEAELEAWAGRGEVEPMVPQFGSARAALRERMVEAMPLYAGLEWDPGVTLAHRAAVEELIGDQVLAAFLVAARDLDTAREAVFPGRPGIRISTGEGGDELPAWIREVFDIPRSDPRALRALAQEMITARGPVFAGAGDLRTLLFRSHERRLVSAPGRLIGTEDRQRAFEWEQEALQGHLREAEAAATGARDRVEHLRMAVARVRDFSEFLRRRTQPLLRSRANVCTAARDLEHRRETVGLHRDNLERFRANAEQEAEHLALLQARIAEKGLAEAQEQLREMRRALDSQREVESRINRDLGAHGNQVRGIEERIANLERLVEEQQTDAAARLRALRNRTADLEADRAVRARHPDVTASRDLGPVLARTRQEEGARRGELNERLRHPILGPAYGFTYEQETNLLLDRRSRRVDELAAVQETAVSEQQQVINDRTRELFRKIILEGLVGFLKEQVFRLEQMVRRINRMLSDRTFGRCRYEFQLRVQDRYRHLVEIVRHYSPFDGRTEDELRQFFEDHRQEIFATEVNEVPDCLDYRNWFRYDMTVSTLDKAGVVMDRSTKGVGSGGEQAVPNYLLILTVAHFLYAGNAVNLHSLVFDEAFYGIDSGRRDQLLGFATDLGLQLFVASPDQDGVRQEVAFSTSLLVVKDEHHDVHLYPYHWENPEAQPQPELPAFRKPTGEMAFGDEL